MRSVSKNIWSIQNVKNFMKTYCLIENSIKASIKQKIPWFDWT